MNGPDAVGSLVTIGPRRYLLLKPSLISKSVVAFAEGGGRMQMPVRAARLRRTPPTVLATLAVMAAFAFAPVVLCQPRANVTYADVAPVLAERCSMCHAGEGAAAGLRLDSLGALLKGSGKGPVVKSGEPQTSELIRRIKGTSQPRMPMTGPPFLTDPQIALFERWVAEGLAPGDATASGQASVRAARPAPGEPVTYAHVAPILATRCAKCHTQNGVMGPAPEGYRLTSHAATLAADDRARVVPGYPDASELVRRVRGEALPRMPRDGPPFLTGAEIRLIEDWVAQGARNTAGEPAALLPGTRLRLNGTLQSPWRLDGLALTAGARSRIDGAPAAGDRVEVRGRLGAGGSVIVERIRRR